jgi:hypothetical protein
MLDQNNAAKILAPYLSRIHEAILAGFRHRQTYGEELTRHTPRTRASLVNDLIVDHARRRLAPLGVRAFSIQNRIVFDIRGELLLQFKKLNGRTLATSNYPTFFAQLFNQQQELPGLPAELPRLIAGFVPSRDWTKSEGVHITMPMGDDLAWSFPLSGNQTTIQFKPEEPKDVKKTKKRRFRKPGDDGSDAIGDAGSKTD